MKTSRMVDGLQKSTKVTIVVCACLLLMTALALVYLMFFPLQPEQKTVMITPPSVASPVTASVSTEREEAWAETETSHTLSTWSADIEGYSRSLDEFNKESEEAWLAARLGTTTTRKATTTARAATTLSTESDRLSSSTNWEGDDGSDPISEPAATDRPQTYTETVDEPMTAPPMPEQPSVTPEPEPDPVPAPDPDPAPAPFPSEE